MPELDTELNRAYRAYVDACSEHAAAADAYYQRDNNDNLLIHQGRYLRAALARFEAYRAYICERDEHARNCK